MHYMSSPMCKDHNGGGGAGGLGHLDLFETLLVSEGK